MASPSAIVRVAIDTMVNMKDTVLQDGPPKHEALPPTVPAPPYRHAAPSGPWPWMDFRNIDDSADKNGTKIDVSWPGYPQNLFGNWTPDQVRRSKMLTKCSESRSSTIHWMDVLSSGKFVKSDVGGKSHISKVTTSSQGNFWNMLTDKRPEGIRVRLLCVDNLSEPVLQMLGTKYEIEPFFFTSSVNWIPSRYQEASTHGKGDHITITLPFVRLHYGPQSSTPPTPTSSTRDSQINTQAPFRMHNGNILFIDLLSIHMVYHPESTWCQTSAKRLNSLMLLVGESVYWQNIFKKCKDPTFLFLAILWYALYAWDESFESLYDHIRWLESEVLTESRVEHTRNLHTLKAHLLHYESLLQDFKLSVSFIHLTPNPAMESKGVNAKDRNDSKEIMKLECKNLLDEIKRLQNRRRMMSDRLENVINLAFANVNIRESASMRQITYLMMIFLPASLIASVFGMNIREINPGSWRHLIVISRSPLV